ncbi:hypothetical protein EJ04DRAFT_481143 [Polyplosphaeria fusca]|uniref:Helicase C-terminal domain-containing protein n=1 Tax=Polyplosphaeria fusca TaxID=682080 RepID=A0A9P4V9U3_9PLEO|nr:hypothetical protein EJ04DRAFT_481143 [Polyplosphaeria fusca]
MAHLTQTGGASDSASSCATATSTPTTSTSSQCDINTKLFDLQRYIALGCLHVNRPLPISLGAQAYAGWLELQFAQLPDETKLMIGDEAARLLDAGWIRLFFHNDDTTTIIRVYLLPEDWGRRFIDRKSKSLKLALRDLLCRVDTCAEAWFGDHSRTRILYFDPWATAENVSLFYLFNKLPSPDPAPQNVQDRYTRFAIEDLLESSLPLPVDEHGQPLNGLKTRLYPYQARSASLMVQREAVPQLQLDPRLEVRESPTGEKFYFGARDGTFLQDPLYYESNRGGILAETMGLGKTVICLAVVLATKGHMPQIPPAYQTPPRVRERVGSLAAIAAEAIGRHSLPGRAQLERIEKDENIDLSGCKRLLEQHLPYYDIPYELPRMNRTTKIPPPRRLVMCSATIIVVPRNLLQQWQTEIRKHLLKDSLKILVLDTIPKRTPKAKSQRPGEAEFERRGDLPSSSRLMQYDIILFTRNRFEDEIKDGSDEQGRRHVPEKCTCPYIGASRVRDCSCPSMSGMYESPLKRLHWLRLIIDEGHNFASGISNAVLVAKQLQVERRWVVSGTPAKDLVGVEVDMSTLEAESDMGSSALRELAIDQRKNFSYKDDASGATKALGSLAANFLMVRPWCDSGSEGRLVWDDYVYRHEHGFRKTYSGFSTCFLRTLEGMVVKTRPEDVEEDIVLPPMRHRVVYLKPCWFDKMTANLFIQVLRANAITSERSDVDYLFHKNSVRARQSLLRNLRQSNFTWTGFSLEDVASTLETSSKYLGKEDKKCSIEDATSLLESSSVVGELLKSDGWCALSRSHEIGLAVDNWPQDSEEVFALSRGQPAMIGATQLLEGQYYVDSHILSENPSQGLAVVGQVAKTKLIEQEEAERAAKKPKKEDGEEPQTARGGVPSSCIDDRQPLTSKRASVASSKVLPRKRTASIATLSEHPGTPDTSEQIDDSQPTSIISPKKRKLTLEDEKAELPESSPLRDTHVVGTTSAKLSYLIEMVMKHQETEKILIFYDGDNAAFYLAQCLEMLYINHRIYARSLDNIKRAQYVTLFNEDPDVRVLLIDVACGALGLNLNAASVVLIVNPINRPGIEAQAIKRAHRIGQTKEVLVETLILEGTIEEAIFNRAKNMSRNEHLEVKMLEDDNKIIDIIQNAKVFPIDQGESQGLQQFAPLHVPQQVFGRSGRERYHRFGHLTDAKSSEKQKSSKATKRMRTGSVSSAMSPSQTEMPILPPPTFSAKAASTLSTDSIFGGAS